MEQSQQEYEAGLFLETVHSFALFKLPYIFLELVAFRFSVFV